MSLPRRPKRTFVKVVLATVAMLLLPTLHAAPPKCDSLFPSGGQRGQQIEVTAAGSFSNWPVSVWVDREGLQVEAGKDKGKFTIQIGEHANGVYLLRFHDNEGATSLRPFAVDSLPEVVEAEPNDELNAAQKITQSAIINGRLEKSGDVDGYAIELTAGQTLVASLDANQTFGSPMDAVLQICSADGFVVEQNDDQRGVDPQIVFTAPGDGTYVVRTFAFPLTPNSSIAFSGAATYIYRLTLTTGAFVDHVIPLAVQVDKSTDTQLFGWNLAESSSVQIPAATERNRVFASHPEFASSVQQSVTKDTVIAAVAARSESEPQSIELPAVVTGRIDAEGKEDVFQVSLTKGTKLSVQVESDALGYLLDPLVLLLDAEGNVLAEVDDTNRQRDCILTHSIPADGVYRVIVRDVHRNGGLRYVYRMTIGEAKPDFALSLASDAFVLTLGKELEIPVAIERKNGFVGEINVQAVELPAGVRCDVVKSESKGDSSKSVKLVLKTDQGPVSGAFRVEGIASREQSGQQDADFAVAGTSARYWAAWLTVAASTDSK